MRVLVVVLVAGAALAAVAVVGVLGWALLRPEPARRLVVGLFSRPPRPGRPTPRDHYYRTYWGGKPAA